MEQVAARIRSIWPPISSMAPGQQEGEFLHRRCDNRKAAVRLPGSRRFDSSIRRQAIGLGCDGFDQSGTTPIF